MAIQKNIPARGVTGSHIVLEGFRWHRRSKQASALFALYASREAYEAGAPPLVDVIGKLRLDGAKFDQYVGPAVLKEGAENVGSDILGHLYEAAKVEELFPGAGLTRDQLSRFDKGRDV